MSINKGRFLETSNVADAAELLTDPTLDLVLVKGGPDIPNLQGSMDAKEFLYSYDPTMALLDEACETQIQSEFPGLEVVEDGMRFDRARYTSSGNHVDYTKLGKRKATYFSGPLACSWSVRGAANFGAKRIAEPIISPNNAGRYSLKWFTNILPKTFSADRRSASIASSTMVLQEEGDRIFFANLPWLTHHSVRMVTPRRTANLYDYVMTKAKNDRTSVRAHDDNASQSV